MPMRIANTGPPITGTAWPRNQDGTAIARQSRSPAPFFFKKFIDDFLHSFFEVSSGCKLQQEKLIKNLYIISN